MKKYKVRATQGISTNIITVLAQTENEAKEEVLKTHTPDKWTITGCKEVKMDE